MQKLSGENGVEICWKSHQQSCRWLGGSTRLQLVEDTVLQLQLHPDTDFN